MTVKQLARHRADAATPATPAAAVPLERAGRPQHRAGFWASTLPTVLLAAAVVIALVVVVIGVIDR